MLQHSPIVTVVVVSVLIVSPVCAGVGKNEVRFLGGTAAPVKAGTEGDVLQADHAVAFQFDENIIQVDYKKITSLEYGQKVGRRVGATIALGVTTLGLMALPMLLSKKRRSGSTSPRSATRTPREKRKLSFLSSGRTSTDPS